LGFDIEFEALAVDRPLDHPGSGEPVAAQAGDEGLRLPVAERRVIDQALALGRPAGGLGELGVERGLVDEDQPFQGMAQEGLAVGDPEVARLGDVRPPLLGRAQGFFCG
jgi:hypothetical protein